MTVPGEHHVVSRTNAAFNDVWTYYDDTNTVVPMAGWSGLLEVKAEPSDTAALLTFTTSNSTMVLGTADGTITLAQGTAVMAALTPGVYVYDLRLSASPSLPDVIVEGSWTHKQGVSD
jgi:hypothetical protein